MFLKQRSDAALVLRQTFPDFAPPINRNSCMKEMGAVRQIGPCGRGDFQMLTEWPGLNGLATIGGQIIGRAALRSDEASGKSLLRKVADGQKRTGFLIQVAQ